MSDESGRNDDAVSSSPGHEIEATGARSMSSNGDRLDELFKFVQRTPPPHHPQVPDISGVLEPEHIEQSIELTDRTNARFYDDRRDRRRVWGRFGGLTLVSVVAVILVLVFTNNTDLIRYLFEEIVPIATGVIGGGGGLALIINWNKLRES